MKVMTNRRERERERERENDKENDIFKRRRSQCGALQ
jgi:hypothetical protein